MFEHFFDGTITQMDNGKDMNPYRDHGDEKLIFEQVSNQLSANIEVVGKELTDEELVEQIKSGNRESFEVLVKAYLPIVYNRVQSLVPEYDSEDVTQEIFLSLVSSIERFQGRSAFATWFYRIAMNRVADYHRKMSRGRKRKSSEERDPRVFDPRDWIYSELALKEVLEALPDSYRQILVLRFLEGLSFRDIAERLGLTYEATKYRYRRAICVVRRKMGS